MIKKIVVCESKLSRKFVCFKRFLKHNDEFIMFRFVHSQLVHVVNVQLFSLNNQNDTNLLCFIIAIEFKNKKFCLLNVRVFYNEHDVIDFDIM